MSKKVETVISNFGFDHDRLQASGEKLASTTIRNISEVRDLERLEQEHKAVGAKIEAMKRGRMSSHDSGDDGNEQVDLGVVATRSTRSGNSLKRDRGLQEVKEKLDLMRSICKRLKGSDEDVHHRQE